MAIHRTYLVKMPSVAGTMPYIDLLLEGPVGSPTTPPGPVRIGGTGIAAPPAGWQGGPDFVGAPGGLGDGQFCEWRSRTLRFESHFGDTDSEGNSTFIPRLRLGWKIGIYCSDGEDDGCAPPCCVLFSATLIGALATPFDVMGVASPNVDPSYGPVLRLSNTPDVQGAVFVLNLNIYEAKDEGRTPFGGG